jgi:hypothetical protein
MRLPENLTDCECTFVPKVRADRKIAQEGATTTTCCFIRWWESTTVIIRQRLFTHLPHVHALKSTSQNTSNSPTACPPTCKQQHTMLLTSIVLVRAAASTVVATTPRLKLLQTQFDATPQCRPPISDGTCSGAKVRYILSHLSNY